VLEESWVINEAVNLKPTVMDCAIMENDGKGLGDSVCNVYNGVGGV
jgi:hypothetical protein